MRDRRYRVEDSHVSASTFCRWAQESQEFSVRRHMRSPAARSLRDRRSGVSFVGRCGLTSLDRLMQQVISTGPACLWCAAERRLRTGSSRNPWRHFLCQIHLGGGRRVARRWATNLRAGRKLRSLNVLSLRASIPHRLTVREVCNVLICTKHPACGSKQGQVSVALVWRTMS